jgi:hypothetical protein
MTNTTTDTNLTAVVDGYMGAWNETDPTARSRLLDEVWAEDGRHVDQMLDVRGRSAFAEHIGNVQQQFPGHVIRRTSGVDAHNELFRVGWELAAPDGTVTLAGIDVGIRGEDGKIQAIAGFWGDLPEI